MAKRRPKRAVDDALVRMRLLLAAAALFVLLLGLAVEIFIVLKFLTFPVDPQLMQLMSLLFAFFLITGLLLFAASAFIKTDMVRAFLSASGLVRSA